MEGIDPATGGARPRLAPPRFAVERARGKDVSGTLEEIGADWSIALGGADKVPGDDVLALRRLGVGRPPRPTGEHVVLAGGDLVPGRADGLAGETLRFTAVLGGEQEQAWQLPLSALSLVWIAAPEGTASAEKLARQLAAAKRARDVVYLKNGDVLEGILLGFTRKDKLQIDVKGRETAVEFSKVAVIALNTDLQRVPKLKKAHAHAVLAGGARLELATLVADDRAVKGKTVHGNAVEFGLNELIALDLRGGRAVYLSDLEPATYEFTPFLDLKWSYVNDGSVAGNDLRLGGSTYDKGLGVHARSRLIYQLPAGSRRFEALAGLDDRTGREGAARLEILVDGKPRKLERDALVGGEAPLALRIDVDNAKELTLIADFGPRGNVQAHVNFAQARLIK